MLIAALAVNIIIVVCELAALCRLKNKLDIFKYYTYQQNLLALLVSIGFCCCAAANLLFSRPVPEFVSGLRYVAASGLAATMFIYFVFLSAKEGNRLSDKDFVKGFSPQMGNFILHILCPALSLLSFLLFERQLTLEKTLWTVIVAIPSSLYWLVYLLLSAAKLWEEPYDFSVKKGKYSALLEVLKMIALPVSFMLISMLVWNIR